jgi:hypothetical protein
MSHTWAADPTKQWTRRVRAAIIYTLFARLADWWCAVRDQRLVLPEAPVPGQAAWDTPRMAFLRQLGRGRAEKEWLHYRRDVASYLDLRAEARAARDAARRQLAMAQARLGELKPPDDQELKARKSGETADESVVAARRMRAYHLRKQEAQTRVEQLTAELAGHEASLARLGEPIRVRFEVAKTRADLIDAYIGRRHAHYLTRLTRKHPEASRLGLLTRPDWPDRPSWTALAVSPDLADIPAPGDQDDPRPKGAA